MSRDEIDRIRAIIDRDAIEQAVNAAVAQLLGRFPDRSQHRADFKQEGWAFLLDRPDVRRRASRSCNRASYLQTAVYRHLLRLANREWKIGRHRGEQKEVQKGDDFWKGQADPDSVSSADSSDLNLSIEGAPEPIRQYLQAQTDGLSDGETMKALGWSRRHFESVRTQTRLWLAQMFPEQVATLLDAPLDSIQDRIREMG